MARPKKENLPTFLRVPVRFPQADHDLIRHVADYERSSMNGWIQRIAIAAAREAAKQIPPPQRATKKA